MDRRTIIAVVLSLAIYYAWIALRGPSKPPVDPAAPPVAEAPVADVEPLVPPDALGDPAPGGSVAPVPPEVTLPFTQCGTVAELSTNGGRLHGMTIEGHSGSYHVMPLYRWLLGKFTGSPSGQWRPYGDQDGPAVALGEHAGGLATGAGPLDQPVPMTVVSSTPSRVELFGTSRDGIEIRKTMTERQLAEACIIDLEVSYTNARTTAFTGETWITVRDHAPETESRYESQRQPLALVDGALKYGGAAGAGCVRAGTQLTDDSGPIPLPGPVGWFGVSDRYFGFYVVPRADTLGTLRLERHGSGDDAQDGPVFATEAPLAPGESRAQSYQVYVGPNQAHALEAVDPELGRAIDLGFWAFFGYPLLWLLRMFHGWFGNWGLAIIALTFLVKLLFFPLTQKSFVAAQQMQLIQPELAKIKEEYAENPAEMNRRTMALMSERKVNPLSGCLPMVLQMPVWIALNQVLLGSVDLYHTRFLYLKDLASADPYLVLPLSIMFLMWAQQQLSTTATLDPAQQQVMRFMPLIFGLMFFAFPSGLGVYVFVNMTLSILQQWWIRRRYGGSGGLPAALPLG